MLQSDAGGSAELSNQTITVAAIDAANEYRRNKRRYSALRRFHAYVRRRAWSTKRVCGKYSDSDTFGYETD